MVFPILWMFLLSFKTNPESFQDIGNLIKSANVISNYADALSSDSFDRYFFNSIIVSFLITVLNLTFCLICAYALSRFNFKLKWLFYFSVLGIMMIPTHVIMIPLYRLIVNFGWINSYSALILPWAVTPFGIFLLKQYIDNLPIEIENSARIDGAGLFIIIKDIILPLCKPILSVLAIYTFLMSWNSFLFPFLFTNKPEMWTLPVGLTFYLGKQSISWGHLMAGASIAAFPILFLFIIFQKKLIKGLTAGALK